MINALYFLFLGTFGWGVSLYLIKILLVSLTPVEIVLYRMIIAAFSITLIAFLFKLKINNFKAMLTDGVVVGLFNMSIPFYLINYAEKSVSSSISSVINSLTPLFILLFSLFFHSSRQMVSKFILPGILLGLTGVVIIQAGQAFDYVLFHGVIALLLACVSYSIAAIYLKYHARSSELLLILLVASITSALTMLVLKVAVDGVVRWGLPQTAVQVAALFWLGSVGSGLAFYLYFILIKRAGPITASMITYLMVLTGIVMGVFCLHETISSLDIAGCACILISLIFVNYITLRK